jgi:hypothetical protein
LPPLNNPNVGSGTAAADSPNLASAGNAHVETLADEFFDSRSHDGSDVIDDFLQEEGAPDTTEASPLARRSLFDSDQPGAAHIAGGDKDEGAASSANFANFPSKIPTVKNRFANQDSTLNDEGYDSEGNLPYFADEEQDDIEGYEESPIDGSDAAAPAPPPPPAPVTVESMMRLGVNELKAELKKRGRSTGGKKAEMRARLKEAIMNNVPIASGSEAPRHESMNGLDVTARWELLTRQLYPVPEPENEDSTHRPPTERDAAINPKYGFVETFVRVPFSGMTEKMLYIRPSGREVNRKKTQRKRKRSPTRHSRPTMPVGPRVLGGPNTAFLRRYGLNQTSHPMDWFTAFMPLTPDANKEDPAVANVKGDRTTKFAVSNWTAYSNTKAMLNNAGEEGHIFAGKHKPFTNREIVAMLGVYIIDGLAPSPQLTQKMQPQSKQPTHGNDKVASAIGTGYQQKHRSFRHFFACQDPLMTSPPKEQCPNFKVDEFFRWLRHIWKEAWLLGEDFSMDEQTTKMQGKSEYKTRCGKFKRLGDGIQGDCIADDGYTWDFYFRNEPIDKDLLAKGFCPMHCRLLHMFGNLRESGHGCKMDNLFHSVKLALAAHALDQKVKVHGVLRKSGRGCPPCVIQEEKTGKAAEAARGTVKAAVLKGESQSSDLVVASCYDQKPFYMISHSCESITWVPVTKKVWSSTLKKNVDFAFLRWNLSNDYNFEMNDNDIADQLRLVYRFMRFQRNNKWWWALFLWGYEVSMVNSYVSYKRYCELKGVPVQWSHHDWNEAIGYAHLDPDEDWPTKKSPPETPTSSAASASKKRAPKIDSKALSPTRGRMKVRLDTNVNHMPVVPRGPPRANVCQLHRWADKEFNPSTDDKTGRKKNTKPAGARTGVMRCTVCNVNLCIPCWEIFHTKERIRYHIPGILGANK